MGTGLRGGRRVRWTVTWLGMTAVAGAGALATVTLGADTGERVVAVLGLAVAVLAIGAPWAWRRTVAPVATSAAQLDAAAEALAYLVREQWSAEATLRRLYEPWPLSIVWTAREDAGSAQEGVRYQGAEAVAAAWAGSPARRLVLLGDAGAGKSACALQLTLALLDDERVTQVPVLVSATGFRPESETPVEWLARRLRRDYPLLADIERFGPRVAEDLLTAYRVVPVIDGLDELPAPRLEAVLRALVVAGDPRAPLVVACRTAEFRAAAARCGMLPRAAVLVPSPVTVTDAVRLLTHADPAGREAWRRVAVRLRTDPAQPLAVVLARPLGVALVRSLYAHDPAPLLDRDRFPDAAALEEHLLDAFVPALYERAAAQAPRMRHRDAERAERYLRFLSEQLQQRGTTDFAWWHLRDWTRLTRSRLAVRALAGAITGLAILPTVMRTSRQFADIDGDDWRHIAAAKVLAAVLFLPALLTTSEWFTRRCPSRSGALRTMLPAVGVASLVPVAIVLVEHLLFMGLSPLVMILSETGILAYYVGLALPVVVVVGLPVMPTEPRRGRFSFREWRRRLGGACARFVSAGVLVAVAIQLGSMAVYCVQARAEVQLSTSCARSVAMVPLIAGVVAGLLAAAAWWYERAGGPPVSSPRRSIRTDRTLGLGSALAGSLLINLDGAATILLPTPMAAHLDAQDITRMLLTDWLTIFGPTGALIALSATCWPYYSLARLRFAVSGRLPWRLQAFLADAHRLGVLRQAGAMYQFRHATLQQRLACPLTTGIGESG
ncbi:hypothetical protein [Nonomuraea sp. NPDC049750]|uniref:NACHT domain-containing protein n=1 Tax=Nonomuraea sp. NPDC049750 TaxID=3154738 RepID=UPI0033D7D335